MKQWWGPSEEATVHSSGITPSLLSFSLLSIYAYTYIFFSQHTLAAHFTPGFSLFFLADESINEEMSRPKTKEEEVVDTLCSWVQLSGLPAHLDEEAWGLLLEVSLFSSLPLFFYVAFYFSLHSYPCIFHLSGDGSTEKGWFPMGGGPQIGNGGTAF